MNDPTLEQRLAKVLRDCAARGETIRYRDLARRAGVVPPNAIHKTTMALEEMTRTDHRAGRPLLAALAVGRANGDLPGPGFFQLLRELGRHEGEDSGSAAADAHARELAAALAYWGREAGGRPGGRRGGEGRG